MFLGMDAVLVYRRGPGQGVSVDQALVVVCLLLFARLFSWGSWFGFSVPASSFLVEFFWWELVGILSSVVDLAFSVHLVFVVVALSSAVGPVGMFLFFHHPALSSTLFAVLVVIVGLRA